MSLLAADDPRHGRTSTYTNHKCRCDACRAVWRDYCRERSHRSGRSKPRVEWLAELAARAVEPPHGTETRYTNPKYRCRCAECRAASNAARRSRPSRLDGRDGAYSRAYKQLHVRQSIGNFDRALIRRAAELEAARAAASGELADLVRDQERDERWGGRISRRPWMVSLDAPDRYGRELYETLEVAA